MTSSIPPGQQKTGLPPPDKTPGRSVYDFAVQASDGRMVDMSIYRGDVLLIVNTASACGFTPQYAGLQVLYERYSARGFHVLAFPCNQFGRQEPASDAAISDFCELNYNVQFPVFSKVDVNGSKQIPLFSYLKSRQTGLLWTHSIKWNFTKFLVDRHGQPVRRFAPFATPEKIEQTIARVLNW